MGSKASASTVFLLSLNLVFFSLVSSRPPNCPQDLKECPAAFGEAFFGAPTAPKCKCCLKFEDLSEEDAACCVSNFFENESAFPIDLKNATKLFMRYCGFNDSYAFNCEGSLSA